MDVGERRPVVVVVAVAEAEAATENVQPLHPSHCLYRYMYCPFPPSKEEKKERKKKLLF